jgi:orotate phosphoribosyltransferase
MQHRLKLARAASTRGILPLVAERSVMDLFEETEAYLRGHFRLTSGLHSPEYLQCAKVLAVPRYAEQLGAALAEKLRPLLQGKQPTVVVAPAIGGIVIGHEVARALNIRSLFTERDAATNQMVLRRGFTMEPSDRAIVVEDVITTGGSTREVIAVLQSAGAEVLAAGSIIDRSGGSVDLGVPRVALHSMKVVAYPPEECPLCKEGKPVVKPGSRPS